MPRETAACAPLASAMPAPATAALGALRGEAAFVRALLDDIDRFGSTPAFESALTEQVIEELARLGYRSLEAAAELTRVVPVPRRGAS